MTKAADVYNSLINNYPGAMQDITTLSRNHQANKDFIRSSVKAFNFDVLVNLAGSKPMKEKTPDALFLHDQVLYFVEFKEGAHDRAEVRQKIHEGIISLFQYCMSKAIMGRQDFLDLKIKYAVIKRGNPKIQKSFLATLEKTADTFSLKNMEGLLLAETAVRYDPGSVFTLLNAISNGVIKTIDYVSADQGSFQVCS